jgi:hypothetical protein
MVCILSSPIFTEYLRARMKNWFTIIVLLITSYLHQVNAQLVINEGSNKNYSTISDEDGEYDDWIEIYNTGNTTIDLFNYSLSDNNEDPNMWTFPHDLLAPGDFRIVFCSEKNRFVTNPFTDVLLDQGFIPQTGWNVHNFSTPFVWDGVSNIVLSVCSYVSSGYTDNSIFNQSETGFNSSICA